MVDQSVNVLNYANFLDIFSQGAKQESPKNSR